MLSPLRIPVLLLTAFAVACAASPQVGVRSEFRSRTVRTVAVAPLWSSSTFGLDADRWRSLESTIASEVTRDLERLGFDVSSPDDLRDELERKNAWRRFQDVLAVRDGIEGHFEPDLYSEEPLEVAALRSLAADGILEADGLLISELVYQSTATCTTDARDYNRFAVLVVEPGVSAELPAPCVVSHFQTKLVDVETGRTMWHNRYLREFRAREVDEADALRNLRATVAETITGEYGIAPFAPSPSGRAATRR